MHSSEIALISIGHKCLCEFLRLSHFSNNWNDGERHEHNDGLSALARRPWLLKDPFNDVDALILALLSYLPFREIVPGLDSNQEVPLKKVATKERPSRESFIASIDPS